MFSVIDNKQVLEFCMNELIKIKHTLDQVSFIVILSLCHTNMKDLVKADQEQKSVRENQDFMNRLKIT